MIASLLLAGCASDVVISPAPYASASVCAEVLRSSPQVLAGAERRVTTAQASLAWGDPSITLRCGVEPLGPTTDRCITVTDSSGLAVDWVVHENDDVSDTPAQGSGHGVFAFTTYGRVPAVEVVVPVQYAGTDATAVLLELASAATKTEQQRQCW